MMLAFRSSLAKLGFEGMPVQALAIPAFVLAILAMMMLPLPAILLDVLFTFNIALSIVVLMVAAYTKKALDFSVFPIVLLLTTLMRLSLNVASTRIVLSNGHTGPDAAGKVIESFGHVMIGGNFAVGIILFAILMVINFIVITKGAGRIAEVSARFTLDALPGKQMAIDADLNAGVIDQNQARERRREVSDEADFYGAMDGASKYIRGDAIAGILILFITLIGGMVIGMGWHGLAVSKAAEVYVLLAIGDALVASVPAMIISIAAGLIVTRVGGDDGEDVGGQMIRQVFSIPKALAISAGVMALLGIIPGMPHLVFLLIAACCGYAAWYMQKLANEKVAMASVPVEDPTLSPGHNQEASWEDLQPVDQLGLEVGYRLISLVDKGQDGELLKRIKAIRKKFAQDVGFLPPQVHIKDNLEMKPSMYRITVKGVVMGEGDVYPGMHMAINPGHATAVIEGTAAKDPAFGLPAIWIETKNRESAQLSGYTVVDASTVIATHLSQVLHSQAAQLLGRVETMALIEHFSKVLPKLIDDVVPKLVSVAVFQKVLQSLLAEAIHIRDLRTIIEVLAAVAPRTQDPADLVAACRIALGQSIVQQIYGRTDELRVIALNPDIERMLLNAVSGGDAEFVLEPGLAEMIFQRATELSDQQENAGLPPVLLVPDRLRTPLARLLKRVAPRLRVISHTEIPDTSTIRVESVLGAN
ncbi:MAG: flagellar biosynthesis protein FlhA [Rhodocyclaceae bacterium]|jgi:flagellar biosynthesis protein FlhA|nr:flagellar biosynthesis protein FlhA [Rhodocyclaceae bacterium]MCA3021791.1 flagellar biosynthesis protein FlhA [Rhodocyclaceae bacterium]MCA3044173.1 flagellar biosynthesis protein FlhA [Rhodocyclaceae bacterium]MCA3053893.1 flagellar biosynthesis protein FlhA [Rhodocyclaceae bacterium]MCA3057163.1 flagellar biosynthesis protein FlhA [Rhodocyclaceae bacterium]